MKRPFKIPLSVLPEIAVLLVIFATGTPAQAGTMRVSTLMSGQYQASAVTTDQPRLCTTQAGIAA